jgi:hypothetical protein
VMQEEEAERRKKQVHAWNRAFFFLPISTDHTSLCPEKCVCVFGLVCRFLRRS